MIFFILHTCKSRFAPWWQASLHAAKIHHRPVSVNIGFPVQALQNCPQFVLRLERRGETALFCENVFYQPVRPSGLSPDIEAGDERAAGLQNAPCFAKRFLLVGERVEAVHADDEIKGFAGHLQLPHIALYALNMRIAAQPLLGLCQHIYAVIQTGNARVFSAAPICVP